MLGHLHTETIEVLQYALIQRIQQALQTFKAFFFYLMKLYNVERCSFKGIAHPIIKIFQNREKKIVEVVALWTFVDILLTI